MGINTANKAIAARHEGPEIHNVKISDASSIVNKINVASDYHLETRNTKYLK